MFSRRVSVSGKIRWVDHFKSFHPGNGDMGLSTGSTSQALSFIENLMIEPPIPRESVAQGFTIPDIKKTEGDHVSAHQISI